LRKSIVIYDDKCGFCQRSVRLLRWLDRRGAYQYEGSSNAQLLEELGLTRAEADEELKFAAGSEVYGGYDAITAALAGLPPTFWITPLMRLPPVRWIGRRLYRRIAANRHCLI
jgi:predicted DCC family thiol-disulfide oxidoreductase YuxK